MKNFIVISSLLLVFVNVGDCQQQQLATISFVNPVLEVNEGPGYQQVEVQVQKQGATTEQVSAVLSLLFTNGPQDFIGTSWVVTFQAGPEDAVDTATITVEDDDIPEPDEMFILQLSILNSLQATLGDPSQLQLTIKANDDAFGVISFASLTPIVVDEGPDVNTVVPVMLRRDRGSFNDIVVSYEVINGPNPAEEDILPIIGAVTIPSDTSTYIFHLQIIAEEVPENDETFTIHLTQVSGGATIDESGSSVQLTIRANDSPLRFSQSEYYVEEDAGSLTIEVYRALSADGLSPLGPDTGSVLVSYFITPGTAVAGEDYIASPPSGVLGFPEGVHRQQFVINIVNDAIPEIQEEFYITLGDQTPSAVIADPSVAVIKIQPNDDENGVLSLATSVPGEVPYTVVDEDSQIIVDYFVIQRRGGAFGQVSISYLIVRNDSNSDAITLDLSPATGTVTLADGEESKAIIFTLVQDSLPEQAERYLIRLLPETVTGGAKVEGILEGIMVIQDSDDIYGVIQFSSDTEQRILTSISSRKLQLTLTRATGLNGDVLVNFNARYLLPASEESSDTDILILSDPATTLFPASVNTHRFEIPIRDNAFLQVGAVFEIKLDNVTLQGVETIVPTKSPRLGDKTSIVLVVSSDLANGEIGFNEADLEQTVEEPDGSTPLAITFPLTREGTSGDATVYWQAHGIGQFADYFTTSDVRPANGSVYFPTGIAGTSLTILIMPDDIPETSETFLVSLISVEPSSQRLRQGFAAAQITIQENDNPGGTFEISSSTPGPYTVEEGGQAIQISVVRNGGNLVPRSVLYSVENANDEFLGVPEVLVFNIGESIKNISLLANPDGIPELDETFQLKIESYGTPASDVGGLNSITIFVLENDDPYGVFQFTENPMNRNLDESKDDTIQSTSFPVMRAKGTFYDANVSWSLTPMDGSFDVSPTSGVLYFADGQDMAYIEISALDDEIPEQPETFTISLSNATNGARLGHPVIATLSINNNDDPIFFEEPINIKVEEPGTVDFTVRRNGSAASYATVRYRTVSQTAQGGQDYPNINGFLEFPIGVTVRTFQIGIYEDDIPETDEVFTVELYDPVGDIVVYGAPIATVTIAANDDTNGIFSFEGPVVESAPIEGISVDFIIKRDRGAYGVVRIYWQVYYNGTDVPLLDGREFRSTSGFVEFANLQTRKALTLDVLADTIPEHDEVYAIRLINATGGGPPGPGGVLSVTGPLEATLTIEENDDPYGVLVFPSGSKERDVAEDYNPGDELTTYTSFVLSREQGTSGTVEVVWELFTDAISGLMPSLKDLLFLGSYDEDSGVEEVPNMKRPHTGTKVLSFNGSADAYVTVDSAYQPDPAQIRTGFAMSAWVQPQEDCNGFIIAKTSDDLTKTYYGLKLTASPFTTVELQYGTDFTASNHIVSISIPNSNLSDSMWHLIVLNINNAMADVYIDGQYIATMYLAAQQIADSSGMLWVGAHPQGTYQYTGLLQDVRVYSRKLEPNEISELWEYPAREDVTPISGYLMYQPGIRQQMIQIHSVQDTEEEGNEVFTLNLLSVKGGVRKSDDDSTALLTVLKSDNANGLFGFDGPCNEIVSPDSDENSQFICNIIRNRGDEGTVTIPWEIHQLTDGYPLATDDFVTVSGTVEFPNGVRQGVITVTVNDDTLPEFEEEFEIVLVSHHPMSDDGITGTTNTSGASIDPNADTNKIVISESDYPQGILQFSDGPPPSPNDPMIPPATEPVQVRVPETVGVVSLLVVRAQGLSGTVSVEWRTFDRTAVSAGKSPVDFMSGGGVLTFTDQQRYAYIDITVIDNNVPELDKMFEVQLSNPAGGDDGELCVVTPATDTMPTVSSVTFCASTGIGSTVQVIIESSDNAYGVFQFADTSLSVIVDEENSGLSVAVLEVIRAGGALGEATVDWQVETHPSNPQTNVTDDLLFQNGQVTFAVNQYSANIEIQILSDAIPELDEIFTVELTNPSNGRLGETSNLVATVTVAANDDPYGSFVFSPMSRPVITEEGNRNVTLKILREYGKVGAVRVEYATLNQGETLPNLPTFTSRAKEYEDFIPVQSSVVLQDGQTEANIQIDLLDDSIPEMSESVFVYITDVILISNPQNRPVEGSPRIGLDSIAQIAIIANDNANGVLQLSNTEISVSEDHRGPFINVTRTAGSFGEITVRFQVVPVTAQAGIDYSVSSSDVILLSGETYKGVPVDIIDDSIPEMDETFEIRLLDQITGGAVLGSPTTATITILPSDDPNGRFDFAFTNTLVEEPQQGESRILNVTVVRGGGTAGVVAVEWQATLNGYLASEDVRPTGGVMYFLSTMTHETFRLEILADDVPEEREEIKLTLMSATSGGVIGPQSEATVTIEANDNPHGIVEFADMKNVVVEEEGNSVANIRVNRSHGTFGDLEVFYSTKEIDLVTAATKGGQSLLDYYLSPLQGSMVGQPKNFIDVSQASFPLGECAGRCIKEKACASFEFRDDSGNIDCLWSLYADSTSFDSSTGFFYYVKDMNKVQPLYDGQAEAGVDFAPVNTGSFQIPDGSNHGYVSVVILNDSIPELDETFQVKLENVRLVDLIPLPQNQAQLGQLTEADVVIGGNDDANGVWRIYSSSPDATDNGQAIAVVERDGLSVSVELVVERTGGAIGDVSVSWHVSGGTATDNEDYIADGATLTFAPRERRQEITISIRDDAIPEENESLIVELYNPGGGSVLSPRSSVNVVILANDNVAGLLQFTVLSYIVKEGDRFDVTVERSAPAKGTVHVGWVIEGVSNHIPENNFQETNGTLTFAEGQTIQVITIHALTDETPEVNEEYTIKLTQPVTEGVAETGAAGLDEQGSTASITIEASDEPYGIFVFTPGSTRLNTDESDSVIELIVERKFGSIGNVRIFYEILGGTVEPQNPSTSLASPNVDFIPGTGFIEFEEGVLNQPIQVQILEDTTPELDEVFLVNLTSVMLMSATTTDTPPKLGRTDTLAQVTIYANDGTQGVVKFANSSARITVNEGNMNISLTVERTQGTYGVVTVFCYTQPLEADRGLDYRFIDKVLTFGDGENMKIITVEIFEDNIPEDDEVFEVILDNPNFGLELGSPSRASITILSNDDAFGIVSFATFTNLTIYEPTVTSSADSVARFTVVRDRGSFQEIQVPFKVLHLDGSEGVTDVLPVEGFITFEANIDTTVLEISAIRDEEPELDEGFVVRLLTPTGGAILGYPTVAYINVADNDAPYGLIQIYPYALPGATSVNVEEDAGTAFFTVYRARGTLDTVSVQWQTMPGSATALSGSALTELSVVQTLQGYGIRSWHSFSMGSDQYLVLINNANVGPLTTEVGSDGSASDNMTSIYNSVLYVWQGQFVPLQAIETDGGIKAATTMIGGAMYLAVANHGSIGKYRTSSRIYSVGISGTLTLIQDIPSDGASDVTFFTVGVETYLIITNEIDNNDVTTISSQVLLWSGSQFVQSQLLSTSGAVGVTAFKIGGATYVAVANRYDSSKASLETNSMLYKWSNNRLEEYQSIATRGATDVISFTIGVDTYLVFTNSRTNDGSTAIDSAVMKWEITSQSFVNFQQLRTNNAQSVSAYTDNGNMYLSIGNARADSTIYVWRNVQFEILLSAPPAFDLTPVTVDRNVGDPVTLLASASYGDGQSLTVSYIYQIVSLGEGSDYTPRSGMLTFGHGESQRTVTVSILDDETPEDTEDFYVAISNPTGGAEISNLNRVMINILSNDNAHGIIAFDQDSLNVHVEELQNDNPVVLTVRRQYGTAGLVVVEWQATGDHSSNDITPTSGQIEFPDGLATAVIYLNIMADAEPELDEVSYIQLTRVVQSGTALPGRGATISSTEDMARLTVIANDSPHGVIAWSLDSLRMTVDEPEQEDFTATVTLKITREQGSQGTVSVTYSTSEDLSVPSQQRASPGDDFVNTVNTITMNEGITEMDVYVTVRADGVPEGPEVFLVNITSVSLASGIPIGGAAPSVKIGQSVAEITITENDYARGVLQFDVEKNDLGEVEVYEGGGTDGLIQLKVSRSEGTYTAVQVSWQAFIASASSDDFSPMSGSVSFQDGQRESSVDITITDDSESENDETFNVRLYNPTNGAVLGSETLVTVKIIKNDSPFGLFGFTSTEESVMESATNNDPNGVVTFVVQRSQGSVGTVQVQWQVEEAGRDDISPSEGTLIFSAGVTQQFIRLRAVADEILEGEERFSLDIISVTNDADISPVFRHATIVILSNRGAAGIVSILPPSRNVLIGEPGVNYDGSAYIFLTRGQGVFGSVNVNWQLSPRDEATFQQTSGTVVFEDQLQNTTITLQTKDDEIPELQQLYRLQLVSVSGGASIDITPGANEALITVAASDNPHGIFQFEVQQVTVSEDERQVNLNIVRTGGLIGRVQVSYSTASGSALAGQDFSSSSRSVVFNDGVRLQVITIVVLEDNEPEGPENFFVNITSLTLLSHSDNDYTDYNGLSKDMPPEMGPISVVTIEIDKNDNAEGIIEFGEDAVNFVVSEDIGTASIPVQRVAGSYGLVSATYSPQSLTAMPNGLDYSLSNGEVIFQDGQSVAYIDVDIIDDSDKEFEETFEIRLIAATGGAILGNSLLSTVTIAKSDGPDGLIGFLATDINRVIENPDTERDITFSIERTGGLDAFLTPTEIKWRILGPNSEDVLTSTEDISTVDGNVQGSIFFFFGERGSKSLTLQVQPYPGAEQQEIFIVEIYEINGAGEMKSAGNTATLTIMKHGDPNGVVLFTGESLQAREFNEPEITAVPTIVTFPITRREGTVGDIYVNWQVQSMDGQMVTDDVTPASGRTLIPNAESDSQIAITILPDDIPELREMFQLVLISADGGAEIDPNVNISTFYILANDDPHGVFGVHSNDQTVTVGANLNRHVSVNVSRSAGLVGDVRVDFTLQYDNAEPGNDYVPNSGDLICTDEQANCVKEIPLLSNDAFLLAGSTFTVTLTAVTYLGTEATIDPRIDSGSASATFALPDEAANSVIGFDQEAMQVNDMINEAILTIKRTGSYGDVTVNWRGGFPEGELPFGFTTGSVSPSVGSSTVLHGNSLKALAVQLYPNEIPTELFAVYLVSVSTNVAGGARLQDGNTVMQIDPYGVLGFAATSRQISTPEEETELSLTIERRFGCYGNIIVTYQTFADTADEYVDFTPVTRVITMNQLERTASVQAFIKADNPSQPEPERDETFFVNITEVKRLPSSGPQGVSPRISSAYSSSTIVIEASNDPYGVLSIDSAPIEVSESNDLGAKVIQIPIHRYFGTYDTVSVRVRTIGGGESGVTPEPSNNTDTIAEALYAVRDQPHATVGQDYDVLDTIITFAENSVEQKITVVILDDPTPEPSEVFFVYLSDVSGGAKIAEGMIDPNDPQQQVLRGYVKITIIGSDNHNGMIGFTDNSMYVNVDEDSEPAINLVVDRGDAFFEEVTVSWQATYENPSTPDSGLYEQLEEVSGETLCVAGERFCTLDLMLKQDEEPEFSRSFIVILTGAGDGATIDMNRNRANVTMLDSDYPYGLIQFTVASRLPSVDQKATLVGLTVERVGGSTQPLSITWSTRELFGAVRIAGVAVYPALEGLDFQTASGVMEFEVGQRRASIDIVLTPETASANPLPKMFQVIIDNPTNGASVNPDGYYSNVTIVADKTTVDIWETWAGARTGDLTDSEIDRILREISAAVADEMTDEQVTVVKDTLDLIITEAGQRQLPSSTLDKIMEIFCDMLEPDRQDTKGKSSLSVSFVDFIYTLITDEECEMTQPKTIQCEHAYVEVARWLPISVNGHRFGGRQRDYFQLPPDLLDFQSENQQCEDIHFIEYSSSVWFEPNNQEPPMSDKVLSVGLKGKEGDFSNLATPIQYRLYTDNSRVTPKGASCLLWNHAAQRWLNDECTVLSDDRDYVECSCKHLSDYAARAQTDDLTGYNEWIYASCFICMIGLAFAILAHHICSIETMFAAKLLMHMCFACLSLQITFVVAAYISNRISASSCSAIATVLHYFFLAQFSWMFVQSINLWKVLVMNDEHTERYYVLFFMLGWGLPAILVVTYIVVLYAAFGWEYFTNPSDINPYSPEVIYGDVHLNGDMCFIPNAYAALAGVLGPVVLLLFFVAIVFVQAYQVTPQWKQYDDVYAGRYNTTEVRILLMFWLVIITTWIFGGLHMAFGKLWLLILFCIFNIIQGLYALIIYTILRNQLCRPAKGQYSFNNSTSEVVHIQNQNYTQSRSVSGASVGKSSKGTLGIIQTQIPVATQNEMNNWDRTSVVHSHHSDMYPEKQPPPHTNNIYSTMPYSNNIHADPPQDEPDSQEFDDLIFALKTGTTYTPSEDDALSERARSSHLNDSGEHNKSTEQLILDTSADNAQDAEHYEMRRISIADTHL
ncbi:adhesion G-protein coupled receptor V1-like isoform X2 [Ptychodera flava]|uniref:adhesion G-protein coupled receptor V1-like isoform X2 n=1 Tax=Ptychodera flava TaxID=63121 RepID=UPI003969DFB6